MNCDVKVGYCLLMKWMAFIDEYTNASGLGIDEA